LLISHVNETKRNNYFIKTLLFSTSGNVLFLLRQIHPLSLLKNCLPFYFVKYYRDILLLDEPADEFDELQSELFKCLRPLEFQPMDDYHVSLSRTVVVRHHWIKDLKDSLQEKFGSLPRLVDL